MNTNSTDFACLVTGFLTDYLPHHRCYSKNTVLSYRDTLKLFLRFLKEEKGISPNSFYIKDFKREIVIEFLEWYRNSGAGISAANQLILLYKNRSRRNAVHFCGSQIVWLRKALFSFHVLHCCRRFLTSALLPSEILLQRNIPAQ